MSIKCCLEWESLSTSCFQNIKKFLFLLVGLLCLFFVLHLFIYLCWSIIALQCCVGFCHTTSWISYIYMYIYPLPLEPPSTPLDHHRAPSWVPRATLAILHMVVCIRQCYSLNSSHPPPCLHVHFLHLCLCSCPVNRLIGSIYFHLRKIHGWRSLVRLQSMGSLRVGHDWATSLWLFTFMHWRRKWQPTPVFLLGESQGQRSLMGCCLWGRTESDTTEATWQQRQQQGDPTRLS